MASQSCRTAGPDTSAPKPESGIIITTTYFGWSQGANDAKLEVEFLPNTCAVPVLPATHTLPSGKPPNVPAAVPDVITPARALRMYASVVLEAGRCPTTGGLIFCTTFPVGLRSSSPIRGLYSVPPLARAAYPRASCSGVTDT